MQERLTAAPPPHAAVLLPAATDTSNLNTASGGDSTPSALTQLASRLPWVCQSLVSECGGLTRCSGAFCFFKPANASSKAYMNCSEGLVTIREATPLCNHNNSTTTETTVSARNRAAHQQPAVRVE